jgi:hypothetical protein
MKMPLTKGERKKVRRLERAAREKDKQGQIAMGIIKAPVRFFILFLFFFSFSDY